MLSTEGQAIENENYDPDNPYSAAHFLARSDSLRRLRARWHLSAASWYPRMTSTTCRSRSLTGDRVWAVTADELGVERVVRYRIVVGGG